MADHGRMQYQHPTPQYQHSQQYLEYQQPQQSQQYQQYQQPAQYPAQHNQYSPPQQYPQTQQPQQYYHSQQYQQGQQPGYSDYQQQYSHPASPAYQYPSHQQPAHQYYQQSQPHQYSSQNLPQHYAHQGYSNQPQPYQAQQNSVPQYGHHQQSHQYQHQRRQPFVPPSQGNSQTCYNCGIPGHFAQDCPEPKRDVPVGDIERQKRRTSNHHKSSTSATTSLSMSSAQADHSPAFPQGYSPSQYSQPGYINQLSRLNSTSAHPAQIPTQQHSQQHYSQHHSPQFQPPSQQSSDQSSSRIQISPPRSSTFSAPATPNTANLYHGFQVNTAKPTNESTSQTLRQESISQAVQMSPPQPSGTSAPAITPSPLSPQQQDRANHDVNNSASTEGGQRDISLLSSVPAASAMASFEGSSEIEDEEDDLESLDVPDLSLSAKEWGEKVVKPISLPIPSNYFVSETIWPIPPPAPGGNGLCLSKYVRDVSIDGIMQNIKDSNYWKDFQEDTIFLEIADQGNVVSIDDCQSQVRERRRPKPDIELLPNTRSQSRGTAPRPDVAEMASSLEILERALAEAKAKQAEMINNRKRLKKMEQTKKTHTLETIQLGEEEGEGKPVKIESKSPQQTSASDQNDRRQQDPKKHLAALDEPTALGPSSRTGPNGLTGNGNVIRQSRCPIREDVVEPKHAQQSGHPFPPPPPPVKTSPGANNMQSDPTSHISLMDPHGPSANMSEDDGGQISYATDMQAFSPARRRSEHSSSRKRSYDCRDSSSDDDETEGRRQADDFTPKLKRRQPKVAEAYSRRW